MNQLIPIVFIKKYSFWLGIFLLLFCPDAAFSQPAHHWRFWTVEDGLAETWSQTVKISPQGYIWISHGEATDYASCLDGLAVCRIPRVYPYTPIFQFKDSLWTARMINDFVMLYQSPWENTSSPLQWTLADETASRMTFTPLFEMNDDSVLYLDAPFLALFNKKQKKSLQIIQSKETGIGNFHEMIKEKEGLFWISGEKGIALFNIDLNTQPIIKMVGEYLIPAEMQPKSITSLSKFKDGPVVCAVETAFDSRLMQWDGKTWSTLYTTNPASNLIGWRTNLSSFWVYTNESGLLYNHRGIEIPMQNHRVLAGELNSFALQEDGVFWIATSNGVARHANMLWESAKGFPNDKLTCNSIVEDNHGRVWFACIDRLICFDHGQWQTYMLPKDQQTKYWHNNSLASLENGKIVVGSISAALTFDQETHIFEKIPLPRISNNYFMRKVRFDTVWFIGLLKAERIIASMSFNGITIKDSKERPMESIDPSIRNDDFSIRDYTIMDDGKYLFATLSGVLLLNGSSLTKLGPMNSAFCTLKRDNGEFWFGGIDEIQSYNGKEWQLVKSGMDHVYSMRTTRDGSIWVTTVNGVYRFRNGNWMKYTSEEGLPDCAYYTLLEDSQQRLWVGSSRGVYIFQPDCDKEAPKTSLDPAQNVNIVSPEGKVQILFSGMDKWKYSMPGRLLFSYRLDQGEWSPFTSNTVFSATGIPAGEHTFDVHAMDPNGNIETVPSRFSFTVQQYWYWNPKFILLILSGLLSLSYLSHHLIKAQQGLHRLASTDALTGLYNRRQFLLLFESELSRSKRYKKSLTLLMIDADHFKAINDRFGHQAGDTALQILARIIKEQTRESDLTGRLGGEEFVVLLPETNMQDAVTTAERIRLSVMKEQILIDHSSLSFTISIGIASIRDGNETVSTLLSSADQAVYAAKDKGRNRVECTGDSNI